MRFSMFLIICCAVVFLASCVNHSKDYLKKGSEIFSIVVPPGVPMIKQSPYYPIPAVPYNGAAKSVTLKPPTLQRKFGEVPKRS